jgi:ectoine hydroxylase-related dioxygenase (phytanoyl-CoA dioxygenase family)
VAGGVVTGSESTNTARLGAEYAAHGYFVVRRLFDESELAPVRDVVRIFHQRWRQQHADLYQARAVNSAYLTGTQYLQPAQRLLLFNFIGNEKIGEAVRAAIPERPAFINTQLFFNPFNAEQRNYWHRDPQYHLTVEQQRCELASGPNVVHFRVALQDEPGIELIPGTHRRWDSDEELAVRLQQHGRTHSDALDAGVAIKLDAGDLLVFSAQMIHRGLYGLDRLALDILLAESRPEVAGFIDDDCLPEAPLRSAITDTQLFDNAARLRAKHASASAAKN